MRVRLTSSRVQLPAPRSPDASQAKKSPILKDSPKKLAFYLAYSNAIAAGDIGPGKRSSKAKTEELATKHSVPHPRQYFERLKKRIAATGRINRHKRAGDMMILERDTKKVREKCKALEKFTVAER